jgi:cob(I)alamin adenosyltransferase
VLALDEWLEDLNGQLAPLREFILPAGSMATATAHVVRTVARRAERSLLWLVERETSDARRAALAREAGPQHYLNRLSDLMFVMARSIGRIGGRPEVYWRRESDRPKDNEAGS